jgi:isoamylase
MTEEDWNNSETRCFGLRLAGDAIDEVDRRGDRVSDETLLILLNAHYEPVPFVLPAHRRQLRWELLIDTRVETGQDLDRVLRAAATFELQGRSLALFRLRGSNAAQSENHVMVPAARLRRQRQG